MTDPDDHDGLRGPLVTDLAALLVQHEDATYREFLRSPSLSLGLFAAAPGHADQQEPHGQDEVYIVLGGRAVIDVDGAETAVAGGSVAYVPHGVPHHFRDVTEDLRVVVLFAPPQQ